VRRVWLTRDVFGLGARVDGPSYVDRGALDNKFSYLLSARRHIVIHGDSKQGKSWLRDRKLPGDQAIFVHCLASHTVQTLLQEALGLLNVRLVAKETSGTVLSGELDLSMSAGLGNAVIAKAKAEGGFKEKADASATVEVVPVGHTPADLSWVALVFRESGKRVVLEDFHYLAEDVQRDMSFLLKAFLGYGIPLIIIGVWPQDNYLSYYNGDLSGRVDDVYLTWRDDELMAVLQQGAAALNVEFSSEVERAIVEAAVGNVGTLQRLAEAICLRFGIYETVREKRSINSMSFLHEACREVAASMGGRYVTFSQRFIQGLRRLSQGRRSYEALLRAIVESNDQDVLSGLTVDQILNFANSMNFAVTRSSLQSAMLNIASLQAKMEIQPIVLSYDHHGGRLVLVDRSLLLYRRYRTQAWPWDADVMDDEMSNELIESE
jgi:hypothetical protein